MPDTLTRVSGYFSKGIVDYDVVLSAAIEDLEGVHFDTMVGVGLSGALVVPRLARDLGKHWAIVRKPGDSKHARYLVEGTIGSDWLFVDDCMESGETWVLVQEQMLQHIDTHCDERFTTQYVGTYTYSWDAGYHPVGSLDWEGYWS